MIYTENNYNSWYYDILMKYDIMYTIMDTIMGKPYERKHDCK